MKNEKFEIRVYQGARLQTIEPIMINGVLHKCTFSVQIKKVGVYQNQTRLCKRVLPVMKKFIERFFREENTIID